MVQTYLYLVVDLACSTNAPCPNISFSNFNVALPAGTEAEYICQNVVSISGLQGTLLFTERLVSSMIRSDGTPSQHPVMQLGKHSEGFTKE